MDRRRRRQQIRSLGERMDALLEGALGRAPLLAGSLYEQKAKCGKPQCKCAQGDYRHRMWCLSFVQGGKSRTRVVGASARAEVKEMTDRYRRWRQDRRRMRALFADLLAACDALVEARIEQGWRRYARLAARAKAGKTSGPAKRKED